VQHYCTVDKLVGKDSVFVCNLILFNYDNIYNCIAQHHEYRYFAMKLIEQPSRSCYDVSIYDGSVEYQRECTYIHNAAAGMYINMHEY
jgi:hypothetical protein